MRTRVERGVKPAASGRSANVAANVAPCPSEVRRRGSLVAVDGWRRTWKIRGEGRATCENNSCDRCKETLLHHGTPCVATKKQDQPSDITPVVTKSCCRLATGHENQ